MPIEAEKGLAWVGERGPELIVFQGGGSFSRKGSVKVRIHNQTGHPFDTKVLDEKGAEFRCVDAFTVSQSSRDTDGPRAELSLHLIPYDIKASVEELSLTIPLPLGVAGGAETELELRALITNYFAGKLNGSGKLG